MERVFITHLASSENFNQLAPLFPFRSNQRIAIRRLADSTIVCI